MALQTKLEDIERLDTEHFAYERYSRVRKINGQSLWHWSMICPYCRITTTAPSHVIDSGPGKRCQCGALFHRELCHKTACRGRHQWGPWVVNMVDLATLKKLQADPVTGVYFRSDEPYRFYHRGCSECAKDQYSIKYPLNKEVPDNAIQLMKGEAQ